MTLGIERSLHSTIHVIEAPTLFKHYPFLMVDYSHIGPPIRNCVVWGRWMTARGYGVKAHGWQLWQIHMHTHSNSTLESAWEGRSVWKCGYGAIHANDDDGMRKVFYHTQTHTYSTSTPGTSNST